MKTSALLLLLGSCGTLIAADPVPEKANPIKDGNDLLKAVRLAIRTYDGEKLRTEQERVDASHARGYIKGLKEASWVLDYANDGVPYILPINVRNEELAKIILHFLATHPDKLSKASYELVALAFTEVFRNPKWKPLAEPLPVPTPVPSND